MSVETAAAASGSVMDAAAEWWYELDADDRVTAVCDAWDAFALENGAHPAAAPSVLGRTLWEFIAGAETRHLLRRILASVRTGARPVEAPFRCDGPGLERHMTFHAQPLDGGGMRITTRLLREVPRASAQGDEARDARPPGEMVTMCSWCNRIRTSAGWLEVPEAVRHLGLFATASLPPITHGMCMGFLEAMEPLLADAAAPPAG
ncbi:MAG TPA: hypothetical protein VK358_06315 [Longimicrobium sp.]|nr:hypothetical protein [Longimicrobium sp.]